MNSRSGLGSFARSSVGLARATSLMSGATGEAEKLLGRGFPIPLPYPEALRKRWFSTPEDVARKKFLNSAICVLNFLHLGRPAVCPPGLNVGQQLSSMQWGVVRRLELLVDDWVNVANIGPEEMGRTAPKIESIEESISRLSRLAHELRSSADHAYVSTAISSAGVPTKMDVGEVVGSTGTSSFSTFKAVDPSRLSFMGSPSFDPTPFLDSESVAIFERPLQCASDPDSYVGPIPFVQVHCSKDEKIALFSLLDQSGRLALHRKENVRQRFAGGVFSVVKDGLRDRLILDARPANLLETPVTKWVPSLGSAERLTRLLVPPNRVSRFSGNDLRDFYYMFQVSEERSRRNILCGPVPTASVSHLNCFRDEFWDADVLYGALSTMAMGDNQAVSLAQTCHLGMALQFGAVTPSNLLTLRGPIPREGTKTGIIIDDFIAISSVERGFTGQSDGAAISDSLQAGYRSVGLIPHDKKAFRDECISSFWGIDVNGDSCILRGALRRAVPLVHLLVAVAGLGFASVELLQILAGSAVSLFLFRRRLLCTLDYVFQACKDRRGSDIVKLSGRLKSELLILATVIPFACTNLRCQVSPRITATDASTWWEASAVSAIPQTVAEELTRHSLRKSIWSKLLFLERLGTEHGACLMLLWSFQIRVRYWR